MKSRYSLIFVFIIALLSFTMSSSYAEPAAECKNDKNGVPTCTKQSTETEATAKANDPASKARMRRKCVFTCTKEHGIWVCRGNGPQCNGTSPWN